MKTIEVKVNDIDYVVHSLNAHDASYLAVQFMPILVSLQAAISIADGGSAISSALASLTKEKYNEIVFSLFALVKRRDSNALCDVFKNGHFIYAEIKEDPYIYLSLLKESFMLSFGDFLFSAARAFPAVAGVLNIKSTTQA